MLKTRFIATEIEFFFKKEKERDRYFLLMKKLF